MKIRVQRERGWTVLEVFLVIGALALLAALLMPSFHGTKQRPKGWACLSNLKQTGLGLLIWANDGDGHFPWSSTNTAGTISFARSPQVFRHFQAASNELVTPKVLFCPMDKERAPARDFSKVSNANLSYLIGLDASGDNPRLLLSGDRNIIGGTLSNGFLRLLNPASEGAGWTTEMHNSFGNVAFADGSAQQITAQSLREELKAQTLPIVRLAIP